MRPWLLFALLCVSVCLSVGLLIACGDDDDDDDDNNDAGDDDDNTTGTGCAGICQRGYECFGDEYYEYGGYENMDECIEQCENDMASLDETTANCIFGCNSITDCEDWAACTSACAGY
ncbi:MAG TPA: hypothetical protein PKW95_02565 [bacterium]|nr:hypothetical protein [bacterium]